MKNETPFPTNFIWGTATAAHQVEGNNVNDDTKRVEYYRRALNGVVNCLNDGLDVRGYYAWSAFDNFEWMLGYHMKFGLIGVNRETQERLVKPSARWLGQVARAGSILS